MAMTTLTSSFTNTKHSNKLIKKTRVGDVIKRSNKGILTPIKGHK